MNPSKPHQQSLSAIFAAILMVPAALGAPPAAAQEERISALEEVIVTARKREESLQDAPLAVTALSADILEARGLNSLADLGAGAVPTLKAQPYPNAPSTLIIGMRGTGAADAGQITTEIPVGIYIDGVYLGRSQGLAADLLDLERVEILRGPQGSLYGRNSVGGAVNFVSRKPSGEFGFQQTLSWGDKWGERRSVTHVDIPAIGAVSARLSLLDAKDDGWVDNTRTEANNFNYGYEDQEGVRLALRWQIGNTIFDYSYDDSETENTQSFFQSTAADGGNGFGITPEGIRQLNIAAGNVRSTPLTLGTQGGAGLEILEQLEQIVQDIQTEGNGGMDSDYAQRWLVPTDDRLSQTPVARYVRPTVVEAKGHNLTIEAEVSENFSIKYIGSYRELSQQTFNAYGGPLTGGAGLTNAPVGGIIDQEQTTHELQFLGEALEGRLKYVAGLYYFKEDVYEAQGNNRVAYESVIYNQGLVAALGNRAGELGARAAELGATAAELGARAGAIGQVLAGLGPNPTMPDPAAIPGVLAALAPLGFTNPATAIQMAGAEAQAAGAEAQAAGAEAALFGAEAIELGSQLGFLLSPSVIPGVGLTGLAVLDENNVPIPFSSPEFLSPTREVGNERAPARDFRTIVDVSAESYAAFAQITYSVTELLDLTLGARYTEDQRSGTRIRASDIDDNTRRSVDSDNLDYSITLDYDVGGVLLLEDATVYVRWATGYKAGGIDRRSIDFVTYDDETLESLEVGLKTDFWERRGRFNLAIFTSDYEDKQTTYQDPNAGFVTDTITENADGTISIDGVELEISLVPIEGLVLDFSYNYLDWDYPTQQTVQFGLFCAPAIGDPSLSRIGLMADGSCPTDSGPMYSATIPVRDAAGQPVIIEVPNDEGELEQQVQSALLPQEFFISQAPEHSYSFSASYTLPPFSFGTLTARLDYIYSDDFSYSPRLPVADDSERSVLNGRLTLGDIPLFSGDAGEVRISLWGRNLTDDEYFIYRIDQSTPLGNIETSTFGEPRSAGIEFTYTYR